MFLLNRPVLPRHVAASARLSAGLLRENARAAAGFLVCALSQAGSRAATIWLIKTFLQRVIVPGSGSKTLLYLTGALIFAAWLATALLEYGAKVFQQRLMRRMELSAMMRVVRHLLTLSVGFFERSSHGDLVTASRGDIAALRDVVSSSCTAFISTATFLALLAIAFALDAQLAFWGLVVFPALLFPVILLGNRIRRIAEQRRHFAYRLYDLLEQLFSGIRQIKIYRGEEAEIRGCERLGQAYYRTLLEGLQARALAGVILETVAGFGIVLVIMIGGIKLLDGTMQWPELLAMLMVLMSMQEPLKQLVHAQANLKEQAPSLARLTVLLATQPEVQESPAAQPLRHAPRRITVENVTFGYPGTRAVLHDVSFEIRAGETIGIVGPSGAGKTTLLGLAARFFDPSSGRVLIDGVDLRDLRLSDVMQQFALVTQEPFLFNDTVRNNIRYGRPDATDDDLVGAARAAAMHDEILALPNGYDTVVGVGGVRLSGGQRQRLNVARALAKDAPILLLDEATSALDSLAELDVQRAIDTLMRGRTSLIVAHRLSTLRNADRIIVLRKGRLEAIGRHEELLVSNATYRRLWDAQSRMDRTRTTAASSAECR